MARYTYRLTPADGGYLAECVEIDAQGEGATREIALDSLRQAITERMTPEAVALPSQSPQSSVELIEAAPAEARTSPQGPGEA